MVASNTAAVPAALRDRGNAGGRGMVGPNTVLGVELGDEDVEAQVLVVDLGRGAGLSEDRGDPGVTWECGDEPDMAELLGSAEAWLGEGLGGRISDYLTAEEGPGEVLAEPGVAGGVEELPISTLPWTQVLATLEGLREDFANM